MIENLRNHQGTPCIASHAILLYTGLHCNLGHVHQTPVDRNAVRLRTVVRRDIMARNIEPQFVEETSSYYRKVLVQRVFYRVNQ